MPVCESQAVFFFFLEECMNWGHYHVRCDDGACCVTVDRTVAVILESSASHECILFYIQKKTLIY